MPLREVTTHAALLADLAVRQPVRNPSRYAFQARHGLHARRIPLCFFFERTGACTPTSGWSSRARRARHPRELRWPVLCGWCGAYSEWWTGSGRALGSPRRSGFRTRAFASVSGSRLGLSPHAFASSLTAARGARRNRPVRPDPLVFVSEMWIAGDLSATHGLCNVPCVRRGRGSQREARAAAWKAVCKK